jgi:5-methylcytosine-specific restriction endonuclease McrA
MSEIANESVIPWEIVHNELERLARQKASMEADEAIWIRAAIASGMAHALGYTNVAAYLHHRFGYPLKIARERVRVARALKELPILASDLREQRMSWSAIREVTRVATPWTEGEWRAASVGKSVREVEHMVSGRIPGDLPTDPPRPEHIRKKLTLTLSPTALATFREAVARLQSESDEPLTEADCLEEMARRALHGPKEPSEPSYQIAYTACPTCRRVEQHAGGDGVPVDETVLERAECDARATKLDGSRSTTSIPPAVRRDVLLRDKHRCVVPGCRNTRYLDVHHIHFRAHGGSNDRENLATVCARHHGALHEGRLRIEGRPSSGLRFLHADGTPYGERAEPPAVQAVSQAITALMSLGFDKDQATSAVHFSSPHVGDELTAEALVRWALSLLSEETG